jgi:hypothetical protein
MKTNFGLFILERVQKFKGFVIDTSILQFFGQYGGALHKQSLAEINEHRREFFVLHYY